MDLVTDTSVIIAVIANEPEKPALIAHTTGADLIAPASVHWEIGNAFSAMLKRKRITLPQTHRAIAAYNQIPIRFIDVDLVQALNLTHQLGVYAYDAYILICALNQNCSLIALDSGLIHAAKALGITTIEVRA
jgi:predicted nucleic acid-binding protein